MRQETPRVLSYRSMRATFRREQAGMFAVIMYGQQQEGRCGIPPDISIPRVR